VALSTRGNKRPNKGNEEGTRGSQDITGKKAGGLTSRPGLLTRCGALFYFFELQAVFLEERSKDFMTFIQRLAELRGVMYRRLSTTVEEDLHNSTLLRELTEKRKNAQDELETLQRHLANEKKEREK